MEKNQFINENKNSPLSPFGIWWVQLEDDGKYYIHQSKETTQVFGHSVDIKKREVFSKGWYTIAKKVIEINKDFEEKVWDVKRFFEKLIRNEWDSYVNYFPWLDQQGNLIWIENQLLTVRKENEVPTLIVGSSVDITEQMNMNVSMEQLKQANDRAIDLANFLVWSIDYSLHPDGSFYYGNQRYQEKLGLEPNNEGFLSLQEFFDSAYPDTEGEESLKVLLDLFHQSLNNEFDEFLHILVKHKNLKTGEAVFLEHNTKVEKRREDGSVLMIGGYVLDVTKRIQMERKNEQLAEENKQLLRAYELAVKSGRVMIWYIDAHTMEEGYYYGNDLHAGKLGLSMKENGLYCLKEFHNTIYIGDLEGEELGKEYNRLRKETQTSLNSFEKVIVKHQNIITKEILYLEHNFEVETRDEDGNLLIRGGFMTDVTDEVKYQKRNEYLMKYDAMTDLLNRNSFEKFIESEGFPKEYSLIVIDIDGLKFINDAFGHIMGDKAIRFTATKLIEKFSNTSEIFRIGGDEYAVISNLLEYDLLEHKLADLKDSLVEFYNQNNISINISCGVEVVHATKEFTEAFIEAENVMYRRKLNERSSRKSRTMETVLETLNQKTQETRAHCQRMGKYAVKLMREYGYHRGSDFEDMRLLCKVHDIGKITVSENILSKPGELTSEEYTKIKSHAEAGYKIVRNIVDSDDIAYGVLYHHERIDGTGYPFGLKGDEIPDYAKIVAICDAYDVMITGRTYSKPKELDEIFEELRDNAGTQFDEELVELFIKIIEKEKAVE